MKITDIQIERYKVWNHLALPLQSSGLNVFYGPNEAGKTTLLRFIQEVLYGAPSWDIESAGSSESAWNGALRLAHEGRFCEVRRWSDHDGSEGLEFQELDPSLAWNAEPDWAISQAGDFESAAKVGHSAESSLREILAETHAGLFRHVFAIGLNELQELATLHDEEVARQIYGLSLGLEGRRLLAVSSRVGQDSRKSECFSRNFEQIAHLMERDAELRQEWKQYAGQRDRHRQLTERQADLESQVQDLKARQADQERELRGYETLQRVWEPWHQVREYEAALRALPPMPVVAGMDPSRLSILETELRDLARKRKPALAEIRRLRKAIRAAGKSASQEQHAAEMQGFLNQRDWVAQIEHEVELASARARELKTEFEARQKALGPEWPVHRLSSIDTSHAAYTRLVDHARAFQSAQARQTSLRKRYEKHAAACHQRQAEWDQQIEALPENSLEKAIEATRRQLVQVDELTRLKIQENELEQRIASQNRELTRLQDHSQIPHWVPGFLLFLAVSGLVLSALGFYTSLTSNGIAGLILGLVGIAGFAIARGFHLDSEGQQDGEFSRVRSAIRQQEQSLYEIRELIQRHTPQTWIVTATETEQETDSRETILNAKLSDRLSDLKRMENRQRRLQSRRRRLSRMRKAMQTRQREVAETRQAWCAALKQCGLEETLQIEAAFELWQKIAEVMEHMRTWDAARETADEVMLRHESFCRRLADLGARTGHGNLDYNYPLQVLDIWQKDLSHRGEDNQEQLQLKRELRDRKREANRLKQRILTARTARSALLAQVGAASREDFEHKLIQANQRRELEELLQLAKAELAALSQANPELAIVEEHLLAYNAGETQDAIDLLKLELEELESHWGEAIESLGRVKQELNDLETDRRPAAIRFERESLRSQLRECLARNAALHLGAKAVGQIRKQFEQSCQPRILEIASDYLAQLTCGKYLKIWTTLGEQRLQLMDADETRWSVEQLSNGTREQLFLALRLGLVSEFARQGIELPMVLDDVLVNFDQSRTEAAIQTLIEFAEQGHQVLLFTSHLHLARLCESQGIDPVWLPAHHAAIEHRRAG